MMDDAELVRRVREVLDGVTPGPWHWNTVGEIGPVSDQDDQSHGMICDPVCDALWPNRQDNARFIATSRNLVPAMADRIEALIAERDAARDAALEEAAKVAESPDLLVFERGWSTSQDAAALSTMMAVAAAIRALKGKSQ